MKNSFQPYTIRHISLDVPNWEHEWNIQAPAYFVFWWSGIPLGEWYRDTNESAVPVREQVTQIIAPAVQFYAGAHESAGTWKDEFLSGRTTSLQTIFHPYLPVAEGVLPVSIIICTRDRPVYIQKCLSSLTVLTPRAEEIIVVDNASHDDATRMAVEHFPGVRYVRENRGGLDVARNAGVRAARTSLVAFVDDDVVVHPAWLAQLHAAFSQPGVSAVTGLVLPAALITEAQWIFEKFWGFGRGFTDKFYGPEYFAQTLRDGPPVWNIGAGANMAFRRNVFEKWGYFDERLDAGAAGCNGDSEQWFRILAGGGTVRYCPRAVVQHEHRADIKGLKKQIQAYMRGFTAACLIQQSAVPQAGYKKHLLTVLPKYYVKLLRSGFPRYHHRHSTLLQEVKGVAAGWLYYFQHRHKRPGHE